MTDDRRGFTIAELLVVAVLGSLVLMSIYQVLLTNQRTYRANADQVQGQQSARMGLEVVATELRELATSGGDITLIQDDALAYRIMSRFGIVCDIQYGPPVNLQVIKYEDWFNSGDDITVFADNDMDVFTDDVWIEAAVTSIDTNGITCAGGRPAQNLKFTGQDAKFVTNVVHAGAPIRSLRTRAIRIGDYDGDPYVMLLEGGTLQPVAGPLAPGGLAFEYLDEDGNPAALPSDVHRIGITVTAEDGTSLTTTVYPRN